MNASTSGPPSTPQTTATSARKATIRIRYRRGSVTRPAPGLGRLPRRPGGRRSAAHQHDVHTISRRVRGSVAERPDVHPGALDLLVDQVGADRQGERQRDAARLVGVAIVTGVVGRSEENTSELQHIMSITYADFCLKEKNE